MKNIVLHVNGMTCGHCVKAVEGSVGKLNGVQEVTVHLSEGTVAIQFDSSVITLNTIKETIDDQGYEVV